MHEYHKAVDIIEDAIAEAQKQGKSKVTCVHLVVGENSGYSGDAVKMYFDEAAKGTICEGAAVTVRTTKTLLRCPNCGERFVKKLFDYACPHCGTEGEPTEAGREMAMEGLELE